MSIFPERQRGFTLIELMIVIVIVSVLSAIALPAYQGYVVRSKMAEPLAALDDAKERVSEYVAANRRFPRNANYFTVDFSTRNSEIVHALNWAPKPPVNGGRVYLVAEIYASVVEGGAPDALDLLHFQLSGSTNADWSMSWECLPGNGTDSDTALPIKYLPASCSG
jgi:prepilin-type N-terminal cleavage/methylation domain-containing protein